ncbi:MAG: tRNA (cytidine(34)-2'-O)-methyltransferase [Candidatus Margulisbacteria bacterium]|nr:tRNA (cytidine(34)-2'-O)-methyltransferase [Candidatus Margulisiibacteriota bacterium]
MFTIVLVEPQIPQNTGNIARLCAATGATLHLVGTLGFSLDDKYLKRAGLDYWEHVHWQHFPSTEDYMAFCNPDQVHLLTTKSDTPYTNHQFHPNDKLIFGSETKGIDEIYLRKYAEKTCTIPMKNKTAGVRSLNLSTSAGIVLYEAIRQQGLDNSIR